jgi:hypothetical protein
LFAIVSPIRRREPAFWEVALAAWLDAAARSACALLLLRPAPSGTATQSRACAVQRFFLKPVLPWLSCLQLFDVFFMDCVDAVCFEENFVQTCLSTMKCNNHPALTLISKKDIRISGKQLSFPLRVMEKGIILSFLNISHRKSFQIEHMSLGRKILGQNDVFSMCCNRQCHLFLK